MTNELWLPIPGWEDRYQASDHGRIRSMAHTVRYKDGRTRQQPGRIRRPALHNDHLHVQLYRDGSFHGYAVHQLIATTFIGPCPPGMECLHGPGGKLDNRPSNLRWGTRAENCHDKHRDGTVYNAKLTAQVVTACRIRRAAGETITALAQQYGVCRVVMSNAINRKTWRWVT